MNIFPPFEFVCRYRDPQFQIGEKINQIPLAGKGVKALFSSIWGLLAPFQPH